MPKQLVVLAGPDEGRVFPLGLEPVLLGRSRATESHLIDPHVSRVHCQVLPEGAGFALVDFDSAGGTFVNGKQVSRHMLLAGDIIRIGNTRLQFVEEGDEAAAPAPKPAAAKAPAGPAAKAPDQRIAQPVRVTRMGSWVNDVPGQKLSHYKVGSLLAKGTSGYVFHARDTRRNLPVALKILNPDFSQSDEAVKRFVEVMKLVLPLRHPHLVKVQGAGKTGAYCWIAMEYVNGESLDAVIGRIVTAGMLDWRHVLRVGIHLARALDYAHQKKLIHQSVTPKNILIGRNIGETKLADLMLAAALQDDPTRPISAAGVPSEDLSYMPPERTHGPGRPVDARADIYSLGATLYAMFTGHSPLQADTVDELVAKIRVETPLTLKSHQLGVPDTLEAINQKMLAKSPDDRYPSAKVLLQHMEAFAKSHNVLV